MKPSQALSTAVKDIQESLASAEAYLREQNSLKRKCGKSGCKQCKKIGLVKLTFAETKVLFEKLVNDLIRDSLPRLIIPRHLRTGHGNYQAWILPNGHYVSLWGKSGHSHFKEECVSDEVGERMIKVHAQSCSRVYLYNKYQPPTAEQMETLRDLYADALSHGYENQYRLDLIFSYDVHHPNLELMDQMPF